MILIRRAAGREPSAKVRQLAGILQQPGIIDRFPLTLVSLELGDSTEPETLEACFEAGGGSLFYTFDCTRPWEESLKEFQEFAGHQLTRHGNPPVSRSASGD